MLIILLFRAVGAASPSEKGQWTSFEIVAESVALCKPDAFNGQTPDCEPVVGEGAGHLVFTGGLEMTGPSQRDRWPSARSFSCKIRCASAAPHPVFPWRLGPVLRVLRDTWLSPMHRFGGWSGLRVNTEGSHMVAISDLGHLLTARLSWNSAFQRLESSTDSHFLNPFKTRLWGWPCRSCLIQPVHFID